MSELVKKVGIIGFGTVGSGVYETLLNKRAKIEELIDGSFEIPVVLVKDLNKAREMNSNTTLTATFEDLAKFNLDAVIEASPDAVTGYPYVRQLLQEGITVVTANKELMSKHGEELLELADRFQCRLFFEAAVAGGIPLLTSVRHTLKTNDVEQVEGIVNGTSNFILTKMREDGESFHDALAQAQQHGYAEEVPDKDIDGWDAYYKTTILSQWIYQTAPSWVTQNPVGIRGIDSRDLKLAEKFNGRIKHIASLKKNSRGITASVRPQLVLATNPLYGVEGVNNGVHIKGDIVGSLLFQGAGAGKYPTSSAMIEDLVNDWTGTSEKIPFDVYKFAAEPSSDQLNKLIKSVSQEVTFWFVSGEQLTLPLDNNNLIEKLTHIKNFDGREAMIVKGEETKVIELIGSQNQNVVIYPISGDKEEIFQLDGAKEPTFL
ncbi:homoserine dehydrogenase [Salipaludibacillus sp. HK11]|uniref:homoserine dehydrogenase n=1 Tax=Salipaludibacillus sp. HK11 TaxID=3394320 RepID=UPI0039FD4C6E